MKHPVGQVHQMHISTTYDTKCAAVHVYVSARFTILALVRSIV